MWDHYSLTTSRRISASHGYSNQLMKEWRRDHLPTHEVIIDLPGLVVYASRLGGVYVVVKRQK